MSRPAILLALLPLCLGLIWGADRVLRPDAIAYEKTGQENEHPPGLFAETLLGDAVTHRLRAQRLKEQAEAATSLAEKALYFEQAAEALADAGAGEAAQARMLARAREAATAPPKRLELTARVAKLSASAEEAARLHRMLEDPGIGEDALPESSIRQAAEILGDTLPETGAFLRQALENPEPYLTESARRRRAAREAFTSPEEPISVTEQFEARLRFRLVNPLEVPLDEQWQWHVSNPGWQVEPARAEHRIEPGTERTPGAVVRYTAGPGTAPRPAPTLRRRVTVPGAGVMHEEEHTLALDLAHFFGEEGRAPRSRRVTQAPVIDGSLSDPAWAHEAPIRDFYLARMDGRPAAATRAWAVHDETALYFAVHCAEPAMSRLQVETRGRDGEIFRDDSIEIFLDPRGPELVMYQFVVSADAEKLDVELHGGPPLPKPVFEWNTAWEAATARREEAWTLEIRLPWRALPMERPAPGESLGLQVARNRPRPSLDRGASLFHWAPAGIHSNFETGRYGTLIFE